MTSPQQSDIRMMGNLRKLKTMKRKLFLLRDESPSGPARLEYYDSDKKFKSGVAPKRSITLKTCFNINRKSDSKHKHAIALYTKDDCFSLLCNTEEEQTEWLNAMLELQNDNMEEGEMPRPTFEHIWQVTVKPRGLCNGRTLNPGPFRLCLTEKNLSLMRLNCEKPDLTFQLECIRRCGHSDCFFFMEVGRSAVTGAGELWMQVEDTVIAQNMHETIRSSMKSKSKNSEQTSTSHTRPRTRSCASDHERSKPISVPNPRGPTGGPGFDSYTLPKRSKTISGGDHPLHPSSPSRLRPAKSSSRPNTMGGGTPFGRGHSPMASSPLSYHGYTLDSHRTRTDSMESRGSRGTGSSLSADEYDLSPMEHLSSGAGSARSVTPDGPLQDADYLPMTQIGKGELIVNPNAETPCGKDGYMTMTTSSSRSVGSCSSPCTPSADDGGYMDMSPGTPVADVPQYMEMSRSSFSSSPAVSTASSHDADDHAYLDMGHMAHSLPTVQERLPENTGTPPADGGYLDMSPGPATTHGHTPLVMREKTGGNTQLRPDRVYSYLSETPPTAEDFPKRAYSVGSKPTPLGTSCPKTAPGYHDLTNKPAATLDKTNGKSCSAPHLLDKEKLHGTGIRNSKDSSDLFMEMDFVGTKKSDNSSSNNFRPRTYSGGRDFRTRASSFGHQEGRQRTGSFGKDGISRTQSIGRHEGPGHRPRVQTLGQESLRPRTNSFGPGDAMRPRSSSYGNSRFRVQNNKDPSRTASQDSLRKALGHRSSQESLKSAIGSDYMDMSPRTSTSPSQALTAAFKAAERARVKAAAARGSSTASEDYMKMGPASKTDEKPAAAVEGEAYVNMKMASTGSLDSDGVEYSHSLERKSNKAHRRSTGKTQPMLALRIPTPDSTQSSTDSLSSASGQDSVNREDSWTEVGTGLTQGIGDYIDLSFSHSNTTKSSPRTASTKPSTNVTLNSNSSSKESITEAKSKGRKTPPVSQNRDNSGTSGPQKDIMLSKGRKTPPVAAGSGVLRDVKLSKSEVLRHDAVSTSSSSSSSAPSVSEDSDSYFIFNPNRTSAAPSGGRVPDSVSCGIIEKEDLKGDVANEKQAAGQGTSESDKLQRPQGAVHNTKTGEQQHLVADRDTNKSAKQRHHRASESTSDTDSCDYMNLDFQGVKEASRGSSPHRKTPEQNIKHASPSSSPIKKGRGRSMSPKPSLPAKPSSPKRAQPQQVKDCSKQGQPSSPKRAQDYSQPGSPLGSKNVKTAGTGLVTPPICAPFEPANGVPTASSVRQAAAAAAATQSGSLTDKTVTSPRVPSPLGGASSSPSGPLSPRLTTTGAPSRNRSSSTTGASLDANVNLTSRGSSCSLSSMESSAVKSARMTSRGSTGSLTTMDTSSGRVTSPRILLSEYAEMGSGGGASEGLVLGVSRQSSHSSLVGEKELNYASLDLAPSEDINVQVDRTGGGPKSPLVAKSRNSSTEENEAPLSYAKIDFAKSEALGQAALRENRCPFELK